MRRTNRIFLTSSVFFLLIYFTLAQTPPPPANLIRVESSGLRTNQAKVMYALFSSAGDFPKHADKAAMPSTAAIVDRQAGMPREGVGASSYAKGHFGPPKFDAASFRYAGGQIERKIALTHR